jgi:hypothetical protein
MQPSETDDRDKGQDRRHGTGDMGQGTGTTGTILYSCRAFNPRKHRRHKNGIHTQMNHTAKHLLSAYLHTHTKAGSCTMLKAL